MRKNVYLDIDGVVLNLLYGLRVTLEESGISFFPEKVTSYSFDGDIGCSKSDVFSCMRTVDCYKNSVLYAGAEIALNKLKGFCNVHPWTGSFDIEPIVNERLNLLKRLGLEEICYTEKSKPIRPALYSDAVFEDCLEKVEELLSAGYCGYIFLIDHPYNRDLSTLDKCLNLTRVIRCSSFLDAVNRYIKLVSENCKE